MSKECSIVRDLLPLYIEDMVSADTGEFVKEHLDGCEACRGEWEEMKRSQMQEKGEKEANDKEAPNDKADAAVGDEVAPLVTLQRKLWKQKVKTVLCTGLFLVALFVSAFASFSPFPCIWDRFIPSHSALHASHPSKCSFTNSPVSPLTISSMYSGNRSRTILHSLLILTFLQSFS